MKPILDSVISPSIRAEAKYILSRRFFGLTPPSTPMFGGEAKARFIHDVSSSRQYFEYGSGGSTLTAAKFCAKVFSVESDPYYVKALRKEVSSIGLTSQQVRICHINIGMTGRLGFPLHKKVTPARLKRWEKYFNAPRLIVQDFNELDFVLIDGRFRIASFLSLLDLSREHDIRFTVMFDDFCGRSYYSITSDFVPIDEVLDQSAFFLVAPDRIKRLPTQAERLSAACDPR